MMGLSMRAPERVRELVAGLEQNQGLDGVVAGLRPLAGKAAVGRRGDVLQGRWLGHAFHPLLTDLPLGCWLSANLLDLVGGRRSRPAAQRLVGLGLLAVPPTMATGLADWSAIEADGPRRVGVVHAAGNLAVGTLYLLSWRSRRRGHHLRGVAVGLAGGVLAWGTGYLGGHLSFARGIGVGQRGLEDGDAVDDPALGTVAPLTEPTPG
jgi:uncharacterized membrane protein